jgi:hypothetical protein
MTCRDKITEYNSPSPFLNDLIQERQEWFDIKTNLLFKLEHHIKPMINQHKNAIQFYNNSQDENNKNIAINFYNMTCTDLYQIESCIYLIDEKIYYLDEQININTNNNYLKKHKIIFHECLNNISEFLITTLISVKHITDDNIITKHKKLMNEIKCNIKLKKINIVSKKISIESIIIELKNKLKTEIIKKYKYMKKLKYKKKKKEKSVTKKRKTKEKKKHVITPNKKQIIYENDIIITSIPKKKKKKKKKKSTKIPYINQEEEEILNNAIKESNIKRGFIKVKNIILKLYFNNLRFKSCLKEKINKAISYIEVKEEKEDSNNHSIISQIDDKKFRIECTNKYTYIAAKICEYCDNFISIKNFYNNIVNKEYHKMLKSLEKQTENFKNNLQSEKNITVIKKFKFESDLELINSYLNESIKIFDKIITFAIDIKNKLSALKILYDYLNSLYVGLEIENDDFNKIFDDLLVIIYNPFNKNYDRNKLEIKMEINKYVFTKCLKNKRTTINYNDVENTQLYHTWFIEFGIKYIFTTIEQIYNSLNKNETSKKIIFEELILLEKNDNIEANYEVYRSEINENIKKYYFIKD